MDIKAGVVCSTLGYSSELGQIWLVVALLQENHNNISFYTAVSIKANFGHDSSPILPKNIQCNGDELTLNDCSFTEYDHKECKEVAGVICEGLFDIS